MIHRPRRRRAPVVALLLAATTPALVAAPAAHAGTYDVLSCAASSTGSSAAWQAVPTDDPRANLSDLCASRGTAFTGSFDRSAALAVVAKTPPPLDGSGAGATSGLRFTAPAGTTITRLEYARRLTVSGAGWKVKLAGLRGDLETCAPPMSGGLCADGTTAASGTVVAAPGEGTAQLTLGATCEATSGGCTQAAGDDPAWGVAITSARVTIREDVPPAVSAPTLSISQGFESEARASSTLTFRGSDALGLRSLELLDGDAVVHRIEGTCVDSSPTPCKGSNGSGSLDATLTLGELGIAKGTHLFRVRATDAAGNVATSSPTKAIVDDAQGALVAQVHGGGVSNAPFREVKWDQVPGTPPAKSAVVALCPIGSDVDCWVNDAEPGGPLGWASARFPRVDVRIILKTAQGITTVSEPVPFIYDNTAPLAPKLTLRSSNGGKRTIAISYPGKETDVFELAPKLCPLPAGPCQVMAKRRPIDDAIEISLPKIGKYRFEVALTDVAGNIGGAGIIELEHGAGSADARGLDMAHIPKMPLRLGKSVLVRGNVRPGSSTKVTVTITGRKGGGRGKAFRVSKAASPNAAGAYAVRLRLPKGVKRKKGVVAAVVVTPNKGYAAAPTVRRRLKP